MSILYKFYLLFFVFIISIFFFYYMIVYINKYLVHIKFGKKINKLITTIRYDYYYYAIDRKLYYPWYKIRYFWNSLYIRKDEFHKSLNLDINYYVTLSKDKQVQYIKDLERRRRIAHDRTNN